MDLEDMVTEGVYARLVEYCNRDVENTRIHFANNVTERGEYMEARPHGGLCCGMAHIQGFSHGPNETERAEQDLRWTIEASGLEGRLIEVTLADFQVRNNPNLDDILRKFGFTMVNDFVNPNSGNRVYIYHRQPGDSQSIDE